MDNFAATSNIMFTEENITTNFDSYKYFIKAYHQLLEGFSWFGIQEPGLSLGEEVDSLICQFNPQLSNKFINTINKFVRDCIISRINRNITFETEDEYLKDEFEYIQEHYNKKSS